MGFTEGVVYSLLGAVAHTVIDVLRKFAAQKLPPADLISLLTIYNAAFAVMGVWLIDGGLPDLQYLPSPGTFATAVVATALTGLTAAVLYQRALSIAPLSLTVPYLAFAPVFVVFVSPMFLVGEFPSAMGLAGVALVSIAGYKLGVLGASDTAAAQATQLSRQAGSKARVALLPIGSPATNGTACTSAGKPLRQLAVAQASVAEQLPLVATAGSDNGHWEQQQQQQGRVHQRQPAQLEPAEACTNAQQQYPHGDTAALQQQQLLHQQEPTSLQQHHLQLHGGGSSHLGSNSSGSRGVGAMKHKSAWAIAYYKQKSPQVGVWEAACGGLHSAAQQLLGGAGMSPGSGVAGSAVHLFGTGGSSSNSAGINGHQHLQGPAGLISSTGSSSNGSGVHPGGLHSWVDSQAKAGKDLKLLDSRRSGSGPLTAAAAAARKPLRRRLPLWLRAPVRRLQQLVRGPASLLSGPSAGPALVLIVAFLYSITASLDKLGMSSSSSTAFYIMMQRLLIAGISLLYLLAVCPRTLRHLWRDGVLLLTMSLAEQAAIVLYFLAIQNILVSYMVAIKRINVLLSVMVGCVLFKERVGSRMPYILLMLLGMLLIVLQPGHEVMHHSHHTR